MRFYRDDCLNPRSFSVGKKWLHGMYGSGRPCFQTQQCFQKNNFLTRWITSVSVNAGRNRTIIHDWEEMLALCKRGASLGERVLRKILCWSSCIIELKIKSNVCYFCGIAGNVLKTRKNVSLLNYFFFFLLTSVFCLAKIPLPSLPVTYIVVQSARETIPPLVDAIYTILYIYLRIWCRHRQQELIIKPSNHISVVIYCNRRSLIVLNLFIFRKQIKKSLVTIIKSLKRHGP